MKHPAGCYAMEFVGGPVLPFRFEDRTGIVNIPNWGNNWEQMCREYLDPWLLAASEVRAYLIEKVNTSEGVLLQEFIQVSFEPTKSGLVWKAGADLIHVPGASFFWARSAGVLKTGPIPVGGSVLPVWIFELDAIPVLAPLLTQLPELHEGYFSYNRYGDWKLRDRVVKSLARSGKCVVMGWIGAGTTTMQVIVPEEKKDMLAQCFAKNAHVIQL